MALLGIDLGTTNSLACVYRDGRAELIPNARGTYKTRSAVSRLEDGAVLVGDAAAERLVSRPEASAASFKLWMGTERAIPLGDRQFQPEELSALVLRQLKEDAERYLGEPVEEAVISVPAYFNDNQRCATKLAAQLAGLKVERLINEPSAAALCCRRNAQDEECRMMIVDFGGGTLDVSIVECFENIIEITAIAGDNRLGGGDIDRAIAAHFCEENGLHDLAPEAQAALLRQAEAAKLTLSNAPAAVLALELEGRQYSLLLAKPLLRRICEPVFRRVREVIGRAMENRERREKLDRVVLVGGSARLEAFVDFLEELFGRRPEVAERADEIVALGVGICAGIKGRSEDLRELVMTDVCPFSLGVATYNDARDQNPHMAFLIQRSSMLPASRQDRFYTLHDNQRALRFEIYQGEGYYASENLKLGEIEVRVPPGPAGSQYAAVTFTYDIDGVLHVSAAASGGDKRERLILNPRLHLEGEALERARERIEQIRLAFQETREERALLKRALELYERTAGRRRENLGRMIDRYRSAREDPIAREKARWSLRYELERLESHLELERIKDWLDLDPPTDPWTRDEEDE